MQKLIVTVENTAKDGLQIHTAMEYTGPRDLKEHGAMALINNNVGIMLLKMCVHGAGTFSSTHGNTGIAIAVPMPAGRAALGKPKNGKKNRAPNS